MAWVESSTQRHRAPIYRPVVTHILGEGKKKRWPRKNCPVHPFQLPLDGSVLQFLWQRDRSNNGSTVFFTLFFALTVYRQLIVETRYIARPSVLWENVQETCDVCSLSQYLGCVRTDLELYTIRPRVVWPDTSMVWRKWWLAFACPDGQRGWAICARLVQFARFNCQPTRKTDNGAAQLTCHGIGSNCYQLSLIQWG